MVSPVAAKFTLPPPAHAIDSGQQIAQRVVCRGNLRSTTGAGGRQLGDVSISTCGTNGGNMTVNGVDLQLNENQFLELKRALGL
jgi:hypothetical protein